MYVAKLYKKEPDSYYLWNRLPKKVSDFMNEYYKKAYSEQGMKYYETYFTNYHSYIKIPSEFNYLFDGLEQPIEVEIVKDTSNNPMFYAQRKLDNGGNENVYVTSKLEYRFKPKEVRNSCWHASYTKPQEGTYVGLHEYISTESHRLRPSEFPFTIEDGIVPITLRVKKDEISIDILPRLKAWVFPWIDHKNRIR